MITITLPPELEKIITERAQQQGTTPELFLLDDLWKRYAPSPLPEPDTETKPVEGETMADFFEGYIGVLSSSEFVPGGAQMSKDTGRKFKELLTELAEEEGLAAGEYFIWSPHDAHESAASLLNLLEEDRKENPRAYSF